MTIKKPVAKPPIKPIAKSIKTEPGAAKKAPTSRRAAGVAPPAAPAVATPASAPPKPLKAGKTSVKSAAEPKATVAATPKPAKAKGSKLVRDSFTIPKAEYATLDGLKLRAAKLTRPTKKSEVLRAGIAALVAMNDKAFLAALGKVPSLKTGRPKNQEA